MTSTVFVDYSPNTPVVASWLNDVNLATYTTLPAVSTALTGYEASLAASSGSSLVGFVQSGTGAGARTVQDKIREFVSVLDFGADLTGILDSTVAFNNAINANNNVYIPPGLYSINPAVGIVLRAGTKLIGSGLMSTILVAQANGGTNAELVNYIKGSVIKRAFTLGIANSYVIGCYLADFSVQLKSPTYNVANYQQIGIDLRNITRSVVERVHVGTLGVPGQTVVPIPSATDACQHYGYVLGTRSSGDVAYCGGEVNTLRNCLAWGAYKAIAIDEATLCPASSAHATLIENCDVQGSHELVTQSQQYTAGCVIQNLTVQGNYRQSGNANPTIGVSMSGYNGKVQIKYAEMGAACDVVFSFTSTSKNCEASINYASSTAPSTGTISDSGTRNLLNYFTLASGITNGGSIQQYNKAPLACTYKGAYDGISAMITDLANGMTVTRAGVGDYTITLTVAQPNAHWIPSIQLDANASGNLGGVGLSFGTQSVTSLRFFTYSQNAGVTTQVDPRKLYISIRQNVS